jgi:ABC-type glycerol-3-phosphate transport system substrate-binding protein
MKSRPLGPIAVGAVLLLTAFADGADKKVIRLWQTETEPQSLAVLNQIAAQYEKTHPDVSIKIEGLAWGDLEKKLTAALGGGRAAGRHSRTAHHVRVGRRQGAPAPARRSGRCDRPG